MDGYKTYMSNINDKDLLVAFEECQSCRETGILPVGKARSIMNKWIELSGGNNFTPMTIMQEISNEMAKRYYELKNRLEIWFLFGKFGGVIMNKWKCPICGKEFKQFGIKEFAMCPKTILFGNFKIKDTDGNIKIINRKVNKPVCSEECKQKNEEQYFVEEYKGNKIYCVNGWYIPYLECDYSYDSIEGVRNRIDNPHLEREKVKEYTSELDAEIDKLDKVLNDMVTKSEKKNVE